MRGENAPPGAIATNNVEQVNPGHRLCRVLSRWAVLLTDGNHVEQVYLVRFTQVN